MLALWLALPAFAGGRLLETAVLVDAAGIETIESVSDASAQARFRPMPGTLSAGYTRQVHWLRLTVASDDAEEQWLEIQPPYLDDLRLYEALADGSFRERRAGDVLPFSAREVAYRGFVFRLYPGGQGQQTYYLRLETSSASLMMLELWRPDAFQLAKRTGYGIFGLYYGILLSVLLLNLMQWATVRDALTGYYLLYLAVTGLFFFGANGLAAEFLFPDWPVITDIWVSIGGPLLIASGAPFFRRMLRVERSQPVFYAMFHGLAFFPLIVAAAAPLGYFTEFAGALLWCITGVSVLGTWRAFWMWRGGQAGGVLVFIAYLTGMLGIFVATLTILGVLPGQMWILYGNQCGVLCCVFVMHLAVAARAREVEEERRVALQRVAQTQRELESERHARQEQAKFLAMLSHELKTPLAVIDGAVQSLGHLSGSAQPDVSRRHERIRRAVSRINNLVEQFLTHDRVDDDSLAPRRARVDLALLASEVADEYGGAEGRVHVTLGQAIEVMCDPALLRVALVNLVDNAFKYGPADQPVVVSLGLAGNAASAGVAIDVLDRGPGVAAALREQIFDRYVRGTDLGDIPGAGLGLYLVRRIATVHGGNATVGDRAGGGAAFRIWLPLENA